MPKWEYVLFALASPHPFGPVNTRVNAEGKSISFVDDLNAMGQDGWEIICVWPTGSHVLMKRPSK